MKQVIIIGVLGILSLLAIQPAFTYLTEETIQVKVTKTERINSGTESKYLVYTENEVFENVDTLLYGKFDSADVQGKLADNKTHTVKVTGIRIPFLSWYRNIVSVE